MSSVRHRQTTIHEDYLKWWSGSAGDLCKKLFELNCFSKRIRKEIMDLTLKYGQEYYERGVKVGKSRIREDAK